jgi:hypothetical protein
MEASENRCPCLRKPALPWQNASKKFAVVQVFHTTGLSGSSGEVRGLYIPDSCTSGNFLYF